MKANAKPVSVDKVREKVYVLAGNHLEALDFADRRGLPIGSFFVLTSPEQLMGTDGATVYRVGSWAGRPGLDGLEAAMKACKCKIAFA